MKFCEQDTNILVIDVQTYDKCFVYFLLKEDEVVYVGQTTKGLIRPFSHRDKDYDKIKLLPCSQEQLDMVEDLFIQKYKPIHNKQSNYAIRWGLTRVRNQIRKLTGNNSLTIPRLKKVLRQLDITPQKDYFNGKETISFDEYKRVVEHYESEVATWQNEECSLKQL